MDVLSSERLESLRSRGEGSALLVGEGVGLGAADLRITHVKLNPLCRGFKGVFFGGS